MSHRKSLAGQYAALYNTRKKIGFLHTGKSNIDVSVLFRQIPYHIETMDIINLRVALLQKGIQEWLKNAYWKQPGFLSLIHIYW